MTRLALSDLLADEALGLRLRTGAAADRLVLGAAVIEVPSPARWIAPQWVLLTAGVRLEGGSDADLRALVAECDAAGVAAIGFGEGPVFDELPPALLAEGAARGFPIFSVPPRTPFREVVRFVDMALMGDEGPLLRRLASLQRFVIDALREPEPERAVVERLARFMDASVAVLAADGTAGPAVGSAPMAGLWEQIADGSATLRELEGEGWHAVAAPLAARPDEAPRWLVLASRREGFIGTLAKRAAEISAPLLVAMDRLQEFAHEQELAVRGALLEEALGPDGDVASLAARTAALGLDFAEPARVVVVEAAVDPSVLCHELGEALARTRAPHLLAARDASVLGLVQGAVRPALDEIAAGWPGARAGIGRPVAQIAGARESLRDAELALSHAAGERGRRVVAFEQLDLGTLLLSEAAPERLAPKVQALLATLRAHPPLHEALVTYFDHDLDSAAAAAALHLHPNSLRYRLARVEKLLGCSLKHPATIAELHIALLAARAGFTKPRTGPHSS